MKTSDLAIIFFCLLLIFLGVFFMSRSLAERADVMEQYRSEYDNLCPSPFYRPLIGFSDYVRVHELSSELNLSVVDWQWVYGCVSYDGQTIR